jgi:hypothetical protein
MKLITVKNLMITFLVIAPKFVMACEMSRALTETQFVIDPSQKKSQMESIKNNAQIEVGRCTVEDRFLYINLNTLFFQDDTARQESSDGKLVQKNSNCSIQTELPFQKMDVINLQNDVANKNKFIRQCVRLIIQDQRGQKLQFDAASKCKVTPIVADGSTVETDGVGCLLAVNANSRIALETRVNQDCMDSSFLNQNQIQAGDYESVIKIFPAMANLGQFQIGQPIGARYVRHTLLPAKDFMPRAVKENEGHFPYISAFSTNVSPGNISFSSIGSKRFLIQPTFLVENLAKEFCKGSECARTSSFVTPIAGILKLVKLNPLTGKKNQIGEWTHALKIPSNWSGMAEFKNENNMSGLSMGALEAEMTMTPGDIFELGAQFFEPRTLLDEMAANQNYMDLNGNLNIGDQETDDSLPALPKAGQLGKLTGLPKFPTVGLGYKGILDLADQMNAKKSWSQKYDRVCNSQNLNCLKLTGLDKPISSIKMRFKIGENNQIIPMFVSKASSVFESYEKTVTTFSRKVCQ